MFPNLTAVSISKKIENRYLLKPMGYLWELKSLPIRHIDIGNWQEVEIDNKVRVASKYYILQKQ